MSQLVTYEQFKAIEGQGVQLQLNDATFQARIDEVMKMTKHGDAERDPFSVLLSIQQEQALEQQLFQLTHDELGSMAIFLVPLGPKANGMCYEAVFT